MVGSKAQEVGLLAEGDFVGTERFEIRRRLGAGGMGVVYEAYDRERRAAIALKTLPRASVRALTRFKNEFRTLQKLEHPNLIGLGELVTDAGQWFFTMELVDGVDLLHHVRNAPSPAASASEDTLRDPERPLEQPTASPGDEARIRRSFGQLAQALSALHAAGVVHRDVKPANVLVTAEGRVVLLDFGLAIDRARRDESSNDHIVGTPSYMAPEQAFGEEIGPAADWYAFGVVLYEALTGRLPHVGATGLHVMNAKLRQPPPPRARQPDVPPDLDQLCEDLLRTDAAERPSGRAVHERLGIDLPSRPQALTMSSEFTQSTPFVGREQELTILEAALAAVHGGGRTQVVQVSAPSGMGKSTILRAFGDRAAATTRDLLVLEGQCYENELVPFKALDGVVDALSRWLSRLPKPEAAALLPRHASTLVRVFPALERVEVFARAPFPVQPVRDPHELRSRAFTALRELLGRLTDRWPLIVIIDDMQWADADSLTLLSDLLQHTDAPRMLLLLGARPDTSLDARIRAAVGDTPLQQLELRPLSASASAELASLHLAQLRSDPEHAAAIAREAAGHPLFIAELCRHVLVSGSRDGHPIVLDEAIASRVRALPTESRRLLALLCVAEAPVPRSVLADAVGATPTDLARQIARLRVAYVVRTAEDAVAPYHARVSDAVLTRLDAAEVTSAHRQLAVAFESSAVARDSPERLVRHLEAAGEAARAAQHAALAARRAAEALAFDRAADLYRAALRLADHDDATRRALQISLADALVGAGRGPEAADAFLAAAPGSDAATGLRCRRQAVEQLIITGHIGRGLATLDELLADIGEPLARTPKRALASLLWHRARLRLRGLRYRRRDESEIAPSELTRTDVLRVVSTGLPMIDTIRGADFNARFLLAALRAGEISRIFSALAVEAALLASQQSSRARQRGRAIHRIVSALATELGEPYHQGWVDGLDGMASFFAGEFRDAAEKSARAFEVFRDQVIGSTFEQNNFRMFAMFGLRFHGDYAAVRALFAEYVADARRRGDRYLETMARYHVTLAYLATDEVQRAEHNLAAATWSPPPGVFHLQHWFELEARCEIACYAGTAATLAPWSSARFAELEGSLLQRVATIRCVAPWLRSRMLFAARGADPLPRAERKQVARACAELDAQRVAYASAFAALCRGALAAQAGDRDGAIRQLRVAIEAADAAGTRPQATCARWRLADLLGDGDGEAAALRDAAVAGLAEVGVTNPPRWLDAVSPGYPAVR